jgi:tetratricopeptide (TPR) repeat protein
MKMLSATFMVILVFLQAQICRGQSKVIVDVGNVPSASEIAKAQDARLKGDYDSAISLLKPIVKDQPDNYPATMNLGLAYVASGKNPDGVVVLKKATQLTVDQNLPDKQAFNAYGWALLVNGNYRDADKEFQVAESYWDDLDDEGKRKLLNNRGLALMYMGNYGSAEKYFSRDAREYNSQLAKLNLIKAQELEKAKGK